jgi:hypothetical protein
MSPSTVCASLSAQGYPLRLAAYNAAEDGRAMPPDAMRFMWAYARALRLTPEEHRAISIQWAWDTLNCTVGERLARECLGDMLKER